MRKVLHTVAINRATAQTLVEQGSGRIFLNRGLSFPYIHSNSGIVFIVNGEKNEIQRHLYIVRNRYFYSGLFEVEVEKATLEEEYEFQTALLIDALCEPEIC